MKQLYRKKPVVIEAIEFRYDNISDVLDFMVGKNKFEDSFEDSRLEVIDSIRQTGKLKINTLEGNVVASIGDYIIKGVQGENYPCKPDIFEQTYDLVECTTE